MEGHWIYETFLLSKIAHSFIFIFSIESFSEKSANTYSIHILAHNILLIPQINKTLQPL